MRGKVKCCVAYPLTLRITPAHAGKRASILYLSFQDRDHPRTCGEKLRRGQIPPPVGGSPPHMRGKGVRCFPRPCSCPDHPRTCGEKEVPPLATMCGGGSPPHMRGKVPESSMRVSMERITPAHAGKSCQ